MTTKQAAAILGCSERNIRFLLKQKQLKGKRTLGCSSIEWIVDPKSVSKYQTMSSTAEFQKRGGWKRGRSRKKEITNAKESHAKNGKQKGD